MADPFVEPKFNTCAVVTNAGSLHGSGLGTYIGNKSVTVSDSIFPKFYHLPFLNLYNKAKKFISLKKSHYINTVYYS